MQQPNNTWSKGDSGCRSTHGSVLARIPKAQGLPAMPPESVKGLLASIADGAAFESLVFGELPPLSLA